MSGHFGNFRCVPTLRVKAFVEGYMAANYPEDESPIDRFCFDSGQNSRYILRIRSLEMPNVPFNKFDEILTNLGCLHIWHLPAEEGGFADYYYPDIPPAPAEMNPEQSRRNLVLRAKRDAKRRGAHWLDLLHERAMQDVAA